MKAAFQKSAINKKVKGKDREQQLEVQPIAKCKRILVLGGATKRNTINEALHLQKDWQQKYKAKVEIALLELKAKKTAANQHADYFLIYKSDLNWKFEPKSDEVRQYFATDFDLIVDISNENHTEIAGILAQLNYKCCVRLGTSEYPELYDIVIADNNLTLNDFKNNIEKYLS